MICPSCQVQQHEKCRYPHSCPCQHFPSDQVQIVGTQKCEKVFRKNFTDVVEVATEEEESKPLDMDVLNRLFSAVAHLQA